METLLLSGDDFGPFGTRAAKGRPGPCASLFHIDYINSEWACLSSLQEVSCAKLKIGRRESFSPLSAETTAGGTMPSSLARGELPLVAAIWAASFFCEILLVLLAVLGGGGSRGKIGSVDPGVKKSRDAEWIGWSSFSAIISKSFETLVINVVLDFAFGLGRYAAKWESIQLFNFIGIL